jgi:DNA replication protein DnaC
MILSTSPGSATLLAIEERERQKRGLERRTRDAHVGAVKPMAYFEWAWPRKIDREAIEELFSLSFVKTGHNTVLVGPNGVGKTMIVKNIALHALARGHTVRFATASDMLAELAAQESSPALARRLRRYVLPHLLCIDEVGYLSYNSRYADLRSIQRPAPTISRLLLKEAGSAAWPPRWPLRGYRARPAWRGTVTLP